MSTSVNQYWYDNPPPGFSKVNNFKCWFCSLRNLYEIDMAYQMQNPGNSTFEPEGVCWDCLGGKDQGQNLLELPEITEKIVPGSGRRLMPSKRMSIATARYANSGAMQGLPTPEQQALARKNGGNGVMPL
jgi:hypothetical protein